MKVNITMRHIKYYEEKCIVIGNIVVDLQESATIKFYDKNWVYFNNYRTMIRQVNICRKQIEQSIERMKQ